MSHATSERIADRCPSCGHTTLFIGSGGYLTCSWLPCQSPGVGRTVKALQERLERVGAGLAKLHKLRRHRCSNCGLTDEEYAEVGGYNMAVADAEALIQQALAEPLDVATDAATQAQVAEPGKP